MSENHEQGVTNNNETYNNNRNNDYKSSNKDDITEAGSSIADQDELILRKMGYKSTLHRGLGAVMNFAFGFAEVGVLSSIAITYGVGLTNGGPSVIIWGFAVQFFMTMIIAYSMAEICSAYPSAGSVYHWAGQLAAPEHAPLWSYICGWLNFLGNAAGDASFANGFALFFSAGLAASGHEPLDASQQVGLSIAILFLWSLLNCLRIDSVGWINNFAAFFQFASILIVFAGLFSYASEYNSGSYIFTEYVNQTGDPAFTSKSYVVAGGLTTAMFCFAGYEASAHMAEETTNSSVAAPKGIIYTCYATGIGGLLVLFTLLSCFNASAIDDYMLAGTGDKVADIFLYITGSAFGQALTWMIVINLWFTGISSVAVTGRITYALCRDGAFAYSEYLSHVDPTMKSPIRGIFFVFFFDALLMLLPLNPDGALAFYAIVNLCTFGFQTSYGIPILLKLIYPQPDFPISQLSLGHWSKPFGIASCLWLFGTSCLLFLPVQSPVTEKTMNWLVVVVAGVFLLCAINWIFSGRFNFKGPKRGLNDFSTTTQTIEMNATATAGDNSVVNPLEEEESKAVESNNYDNNHY